VAAFAVTGCATSWSGAPNGYAMFKQDKEPAFVTDNAKVTKTGRACAENWFAVVATGDASIEAAKSQGKISKISYVDYEIENYFVYGKVCTVVKGE
jgi:hypothetical protein